MPTVAIDSPVGVGKAEGARRPSQEGSYVYGNLVFLQVCPIGDDEDLSKSAEWGLGPPISGAFGRTILQVLVGVGVPVWIGILLVEAWAGVPYGLLGLALVNGIAIATFLGFGWFIVAFGAAWRIQVGEKGVAVTGRKYFGGGLRRVAWIEWGNVRLFLAGRGYKFTRTLSVGFNPGIGGGWWVDYLQTRAILDHPDSKVVFGWIPPWLADRLRVPVSPQPAAGRDYPVQPGGPPIR